jgi:hypothetical protein
VANKKYIDFPAGTYDTTKIFLQADPVTGALQKVFLVDVLAVAPAKQTATAAGTNTYTATITPAITAYTSNQIFFIKFTNANSGPSTLNLNGLGNIAIKKQVTSALAAGDITAGQIHCLVYDGTNFQLIGGGGGGGAWGTITGTLSAQTDLQTALDNLTNSIGSNINQTII